MAKNTAIEKKEKGPMATIRDLMVQQKDQIALALPKHMNPDRLIRVSMTAIRKNPKLLNCTHTSLLGAIIQAAQLGLETDGALGHAYLVPYKTECQLQIGYRGMIDIARRSGQIVSISARVIYENDHFEYGYGLDERLEHVPNMDDPGEAIGAYAVAKLQGGGYQFEVLSMKQLDEAKKSSPGARKPDSPWHNHWDEMARKTAVRRLFKYLPVSVEIQRAVGLDEMAESGVSQNLDGLVIDIDPVEPETPMDELTNKLKSKPSSSKKKEEKQEEEPPPPEEPEGAKEETEVDFNPFTELQAIAKEKYGPKATDKLEHLCKQKGYNFSKLTENEISSLIDILNSEGDSDGQ